MLRLFAWFLIAIATLRIAGGDLLVLQVTAWSGMLASRTVEQGLVEAVTSTFDGDHPCHLCSMVKDAAEEEERPKQSAPKSSKTSLNTELAKLKEFVPMAPLHIPCSGEQAAVPSLERNNLFAKERHDAPLVPPPRSLA